MGRRRAPPRPPPRPRPLPRINFNKIFRAIRNIPVRPIPVRIRPVKIDTCKPFKDSIATLNKNLANRNIDINNLNNIIRNKERTINDKTTQITRLNYKINDISNTNKFLKDKMYGSDNQPGYLNLLKKKNNKLENFSNINNTEGMIEGLDGNELDISQQQLNNVINQNKLLENQIQKNQNNYTTDDTQVFYKKQQFYRQKDFNYILYIIFYVLILGLAVFLFIFNNTMNIYSKLFTIILLAIYPFIIERIEFFVYFIFNYVYSLVNGVPLNIGNYYGFTFTDE